MAEDSPRRPVGRPRKVREEGDELPRSPKGPGRPPNERPAPIKLPPWDGKMRGMTLGTSRPDGEEWHPQTLKWWKVWRRSPQAMFFEPTDWESLFIAAIIYDRMMADRCGHTTFALLSSELRRREGSIGASVEDRLRLGMSSDRPAEEIQETQIKRAVEGIVDYAERVRARLDKGIPGPPGGLKKPENP